MNTDRAIKDARLATIVGEALRVYLEVIIVLSPERIHGEENAQAQIRLLRQDAALHLPGLLEAEELVKQRASTVPGLAELIELLLAAWALLSRARSEDELKSVLSSIPTHDEIAPLLTRELRAWANATAEPVG